MQNLTLEVLLIYLFIGNILAILTDICIRKLDTSKPFTLIEILSYIVLWPAVILLLVKRFFDRDY